jgi:hypothetical protein
MTTPDLTKTNGIESSPLAKALSNLDRDAIRKDIDAGQWSAASREEVVRAANASLKGSGLAISLPIGDIELVGDSLFKYTVSGWILHEAGERLHGHWSIQGPVTPPRLQTQADGAAFTYAAKNCILNALMLPRGGNEQSEKAHLMEDTNGPRQSTGPTPKRA